MLFDIYGSKDFNIAKPDLVANDIGTSLDSLRNLIKLFIVNVSELLKARKHIFILSDATGLTAEVTVNAVLSQFRSTDVQINRVTMVRTRGRLVETIRLANEVDGIIVYTLVSKELRQIFLSELAKWEVRTVDLMGSLLNAFVDFLGVLPTGSPGLQRQLNERYFHNIEAIEYTVNHDDGQNPEELNLAEIVIVGVSRTSKTPLSIFISNQYFLRVANVPVVWGVGLPRQLFELEKSKVVGLKITAKRLMEIRKARIDRTGFKAPPKYADYDYIVKELEYGDRLFAKNDWAIIDVTEKSIEEAAFEVLRLMQSTHRSNSKAEQRF